MRPWDVDDPFLYLVRVRLEHGGGGTTVDEKTVRTGFRELRLRDGWFELNGRRIYLRSTHTGNHYPIGQVVPQNAALVRQDLVYAKAAGFNTVRFIAGAAREDQLDFCDQIGLMVYEENRAAWLLGDSPRMAEHFDRSFDEMIRRDRNHPSVVIWGLLNETYDGPVFRHAVAYLPRLRELDDTRLVLLSSGRWDGDLGVGSVSNPGETTWRHEWGSEQADAAPVEVGWAHQPDRGAYVPGAGDLHLYPRLPESTGAKQLLRTMGAGQKPVFLSEYGVGSLFDAVTALAEATCHTNSASGGAGQFPEAPDVAYARSMAERFLSDWDRFGMDRVYCFPEDALADGQLNQSLHRATTFDLIRANGSIAGYNLTGMLDHALTGEGAWTFWRRWKPSAMDTMAAGWAPLRWCLDVTPAVSFPGGEVELNLSLANEDVLPPGRYPASVAIVGEKGWRWQRSVEVAIEHGRGPLAVPVLAERITVDGGPGRYQCAASLGTAAAPAAGRATIEVIGRPMPPTPRLSAVAIGFHEAELNWLDEHGFDVESGPKEINNLPLLLVGHAAGLDEGNWRSVSTAVDRGATAVVLNPWELIVTGESSVALPFDDADLVHELSGLALPQRMLRHYARSRRWLGGAGPHGLAPLRSRSASAPIARRRRQSRCLRRRCRVPMSGRLRIGLACGQLPPGCRSSRGQYFRPVGQRRLARDRRPTNSQHPAVRQLMAPLTVAIPSAPAGSRFAVSQYKGRSSSTVDIRRRSCGRPGNREGVLKQ